MLTFGLRLFAFLVGLAPVAASTGCQPNRAAPPAPPPPKVTVSQPVTREVADYGEYTGYIESIHIVNIRPQIKGLLKKVHFLDKEGTDIPAGTLLYEIDDREYVAARDRAKSAVDRSAADIDRATAELERADADKRRADRLRASNAISEDEFLQSTAAEKTARASVKQMTAALEQSQAALKTADLDLAYTKIYAPVAGRISRTQVTEGNLVGYNEPTLLTNLIVTNPVYIQFDVPERDAIEYDRRAKALNLPKPSDGKIPVEVGVTTEPGYPHKGVINFRENRIETGTGTVRMRGLLDNTSRQLSTGMYARVRVPRADAKPRLMVPEAAVLSDQRGRYVLVVQGADNMVENRPVTLGPRLGSLVAVETGLTADDWVVVNGVQKARPKAPANPDRKPLEVPGEAAAK